MVSSNVTYILLYSLKDHGNIASYILYSTYWLIDISSTHGTLSRVICQVPMRLLSKIFSKTSIFESDYFDTIDHYIFLLLLLVTLVL